MSSRTSYQSPSIACLPVAPLSRTISHVVRTHVPDQRDVFPCDLGQGILPAEPPNCQHHFSGAAAMFGVSGKNTAELLVGKWNKEGGIKGVPVKMIEVDENGGPDKQVTEYRRLVLDDGKVIADGPPASVLAYPEVRKAVLGQEEPCCKWMVSASRSRVFVFCVVSVWRSPQAG